MPQHLAVRAPRDRRMTEHPPAAAAAQPATGPAQFSGRRGHHHGPVIPLPALVPDARTRVAPPPL